MKLNFNLKPNKKKIISTAIFLAMALVLTLIAWAPPYAMLLFGLLFYLALSIKMELGTKASLIAIPIMFILGSLFSTVMVQRIILDLSRFTRISVGYFILNVLCCLLIYVFVFLILARPSLTCFIVHLFLTALALLNNVVYQFREDELYPGSLMRISALNARTEGYEIVLKERMIWGILGAVVFFTLLRQCQLLYASYWRQRVVAAVVTIILAVTLTYFLHDISMETWREKGSYQNGYVMNFFLGIRDQQMIHKPSGYSVDSVDQMEADYLEEAKTQNTTASDDEKPVIITIMSEAFTDFGNLGELATNQEVMPFFESLQENTTRGYALSSVFGAKTPNSEWEYMTGNTMAFLPSGSVAFQQFISENPSSMVASLKEQDYTCVAMHPYYSGGFSRTTNYTNLGFDEKYFLERFDYENYSKTIRGYVSDETLVDQIIERYEETGDDENLYIHAVTMQNHRPYYGYYSALRNANGTVVRTEGVQYEDVNNYLSLLHESDKALEKLITYFENQDRKVEIVLFGDHSPSLNNEFYATLNGVGLSGLTMDELEDLYKVPFIIWTNYDTEEEYIECTSLNYLSTLAMEKSGLQLTAYQYFLKDMMEVVPALNSRGYYSVEDGRFKYISEAEGEEAEWLNRYQQLQYNNMFDEKNSNADVFPRASE